MGGSGAGGVPAGPGYPFIPGGAPAVFRNTGVCMCTHVHSHGRLHGARVRGAKSGWRCASARASRFCSHGALRARTGAGFARACLPWPRLRVRAGRRKRVCVQQRVASVPCDLCKLCAHVQSWQHGAPPSVRRVCALGEAQPVSIIPRVRAREHGRRGLWRAGQRAGAQRALGCYWCHDFGGKKFFPHHGNNIANI